MMSVWTFWNAIRSLGLLSEPSKDGDIEILQFTDCQHRRFNRKIDSIKRGNMEAQKGKTEKANDTGPGKPLPKYAYKGKSVKSNSVGIVEISSIRHTVVGGSILCVGGSHSGIGTANRGELSGDVTNYVKKTCTFQQGILNNSNVASPSASGRPRRRSQTRMCRICRKYNDGPRRHRCVLFDAICMRCLNTIALFIELLQFVLYFILPTIYIPSRIVTTI